MASYTYGRIAYINLKSGKTVYCEIITVRDNLIVVSNQIHNDDDELAKNMESLLLINCEEIDFLKLTEQLAPYSNRIKFSTIGGLLGGLYTANEYRKDNKLTTNLLFFPLGAFLGYLFGAYLDISHYREESVLFPDCENFKAEIIEHCRYKQNEPARFARRLNKVISAKNN